MRPLCTDPGQGLLGSGCGTGTPEESHCPQAWRVAQGTLSQGSGLGLWVLISFSFSVCPHPLLTPVNRSGDPKSQACLQKGPQGFRAQAATSGLHMALGEQLCDLEIWGLPLTQVQECPGSTCGPRCLGRPVLPGGCSGPASPLPSRDQGFGPLWEGWGPVWTEKGLHRVSGPGPGREG